MDIPFHLPGTTDPDIVVRRNALGNISVLVNGTPVKRRRGSSLAYDIPLSDGTVTELRLTGQWTGLKATVNGIETPLEPRVSRLLVGLTFLPLLLVAIGGLIGGAIGIAAASLNLTISRAGMRGPLKGVAMLGVTGAAAALYFAVAYVVTPIPTLETGSCLNGVRAGAQLTASTTRPVSCATAHENEVVGTVRYTGEGAFPGETALAAFGEIRCMDAFATYVGIDFQASTLEMILILPTDFTWGKGDREIACVAAAPNAEKLIGSVRGTAR